MIYLIRAGETDLYKIGYTSGKAKKRVKGLQTGCPHKLSVVRELEGNQEREKWLHKTFSKYRKEGEWFEFDEETLEKVHEKMVRQRPSEWKDLDIKCFRDMYEGFIRKTDSNDGTMANFIDLAILEIMSDRYDIAIQRLMEYQTLVHTGTRPKVMPELTERIWNSDKVSVSDALKDVLNESEREDFKLFCFLECYPVTSNNSTIKLYLEPKDEHKDEHKLKFINDNLELLREKVSKKVGRMIKTKLIKGEK